MESKINSMTRIDFSKIKLRQDFTKGEVSSETATPWLTPEKISIKKQNRHIGYHIIMIIW